MPKKFLIVLSFAIVGIVLFAFKETASFDYLSCYNQSLVDFESSQLSLIDKIKDCDISTQEGKERIIEKIKLTRNDLKGVDFWLRYLEPLVYKKINSPLPVEWETEVFEKFEKPYKREGAGLTLAMLYIEEEEINKDSLIQLIELSAEATKRYATDSIKNVLKSHHHFYLCNRLLLLNLAAIYTTGFECPDVNLIVPELRSMLRDVSEIYQAYNKSFPDYPLTSEYLNG
jgi:cytochrome c peroxidase